MKRIVILITNLTHIKNLPNNNASINSKDRSPKRSNLGSKNVN